MKDKEYSLQIGEVQGVTIGSEFSLYRERNKTSPYLGKVIVRYVDTHASIVEPAIGCSLDFSLPIFAVQATFGEAKWLRLHLDKDPKLDGLREGLQAALGLDPHPYVFCEREEAQLDITVYKDTVVFTFVNSLIETLGLTRIPYRVSLNERHTIIKAIKAASLFNRYLNHHPTRQPHTEPVDIYYTKLERQGWNEWNPLVPENGGENLNKNYQVDITGGHTRYGLKITNNTNEYLYPYLFLFNCSDWSIGSYAQF
jgi:hypothetical protein